MKSILNKIEKAINGYASTIEIEEKIAGRKVTREEKEEITKKVLLEEIFGKVE